MLGEGSGNAALILRQKLRTTSTTKVKLKGKMGCSKVGLSHKNSRCYHYFG